MKKPKKEALKLSLWWVDHPLITTNNVKYMYSYKDNIFFIDIKDHYYLFFLLNKKNMYSLYLYILDLVYFRNITSSKTLYVSYQSFFFDQKTLLSYQPTERVKSLSSLYRGSIWLERELREESRVSIQNLKDTRKLLYNYDYSKKISHNNYSYILNDTLV